MPDEPRSLNFIEEIIEEHPAPKSLVVVSGDRRVQRAARHRGAKVVESQAWFDELRSRIAQPKSTSKGKTPPSEDARYWIEQFSSVDETVDEWEPPKKASEKTSEFENPFPPGYADDLLREE